MRNPHMDTGCVFDTLTFLAAFFSESEKTNSCYQRINDKLKDKVDTIPLYLRPFFARVGGKLSFMDLLLFDSVPYGKCDKNAVFQSLKNTAFVFRKYVEHYFHGLSAWTVRQRITKPPYGIDIMREQSIEPSLEMYVYYSIIHNDEIIASLYPAFEAVYSEMENEHKLLTSKFQAPNPSAEDKLRALSGAGNEAQIRYTFTLIEPRKISFLPDDPAFFLLGSEYKKVLETEYKYIGVTPYSFARAIGNPTKNAIYRALIKRSPLTRADMEKTLHLSRSALDHNLSEMREVGLVIMSERQGDTFYYRLDQEIIRIAGERMLADAGVHIHR